MSVQIGQLADAFFYFPPPIVSMSPRILAFSIIVLAILGRVTLTGIAPFHGQLCLFSSEILSNSFHTKKTRVGKVEFPNLWSPVRYRRWSFGCVISEFWMCHIHDVQRQQSISHCYTLFGKHCALSLHSTHPGTVHLSKVSFSNWTPTVWQLLWLSIQIVHMLLLLLYK